MPITQETYLVGFTKQEAIDTLPGDNVVEYVLRILVDKIPDETLLDKGYTQEEINKARAVQY